MTTKFETIGDRTEQFRIASLIEVAWNAQVIPTEAFAVFDYRLLRSGRHVASLEVKRAKYPHAKHDRIILSSRKATQLRALQPPVLLVIAWEDAVGWYPASSFDFTTTHRGGRPPRPGAANDMEDVIDIARDAFRSLAIWPSFI